VFSVLQVFILFTPAQPIKVLFQVFTETITKATVFWAIELTALMMGAISNPETAVNFHENARRSIPKGCYL
jgi:hypothetical protein